MRGLSLLIVIVATPLLPVPVVATEPEHEFGNWIGATSNIRFGHRWRFFAQGEVRTWEFPIKHAWGRAKVNHRLRVEQR